MMIKQKMKERELELVSTCQSAKTMLGLDKTTFNLNVLNSTPGKIDLQSTITLAFQQAISSPPSA